jgi:hypothetical protein
MDDFEGGKYLFLYLRLRQETRRLIKQICASTIVHLEQDIGQKRRSSYHARAYQHPTTSRLSNVALKTKRKNPRPILPNINTTPIISSFMKVYDPKRSAVREETSPSSTQLITELFYVPSTHEFPYLTE